MVSQIQTIERNEQPLPGFLTDCTAYLCPKHICTRIVSQVRVASAPTPARNVSQVTPGAVATDVPSPFVNELGQRHLTVSAEEISRRWGIGLVKAK